MVLLRAAAQSDGPGAAGRPSGRMSSGIRLAADASPLLSPRRPAGRPGLSDRRLPERQGSCFCFAPTATLQVGIPAVRVLGCESTEEAAPEGQRTRGRPKGTSTPTPLT